jgi:ribulose-5-phosphate 4-epimerase/fuculose-1-phosphate aldolase
MATSETTLRADVVRACQLAYHTGAAGLGLAGHISARSGKDRMILKPRPVSWLTLTEDDLVEIDFDGNWLSKPRTDLTACDEWTIHSQVYAAHPDINAVIHAHPSDSTLMVSLGIQMEPLTRETSAFHNNLAVDSRPDVAHKIVDKQNANKMVEIMGACHAVILKFHGTVVIGGTLDEMNYASAELEIAARTMIQAASARKLPVLDAEGIKSRESVMPTPAVRRIRARERMNIMRGYFPKAAN